MDSRAWRQVFGGPAAPSPAPMTVGLMTPLVRARGRMADLSAELPLAALADRHGFAALWTRDVPLMIPQGAEGEAAALDDPFLWLAALAGAAPNVVVGSAAIVLPLRHPLHVAKAALSLDRLSGGRLLLVLGSGDRLEEFAPFGLDPESAGARFREHWAVLRAALSTSPQARAALLEASGGYPIGLEPAAAIPMIVVGTARQSLQWTATHADAWASYHREEARQQGRLALWRSALAERAPGSAKPFIQSLYLDLLADPDAPPEPLNLGMRSGRKALLAYLERIAAMGVGHTLVQLAQGARPMEEVIAELGREVLPRVAAFAPRSSP